MIDRAVLYSVMRDRFDLVQKTVGNMDFQSIVDTSLDPSRCLGVSGNYRMRKLDRVADKQKRQRYVSKGTERCLPAPGTLQRLPPIFTLRLLNPRGGIDDTRVRLEA